MTLTLARADGLNGVDFADFLKLSANFGNPAANYGEGDINLDGQTNFTDFLELSGNFGLGAGARAASVPEPGSLMLVTQERRDGNVELHS